ncbi:conjugative transfer protein GumN [Thalassotalea insulae]|uniref:Conjugative transfer protein GumN n=1 Tax=Thalassotalea insulae TaxID=2056778 RepID=A0ABQ6GRP6_9GAMM|nr:TraB/GumN family protein [Thalassotalea insulae]GLX78615.1 conjugative transfer protein GumN [Thalassotalea insulae]
MNSVLSKVITLVLLLIFSSPSLADSAVWQVTKADQRIFIGGTIHILPDSALPLPQSYSTAYQASDSLVLETAIPEPSDRQFQQQLAKAIALAPGQSLTEYLSQKTLKTLTTYLEAAGVNLAAINQFKPGYVASLLAKLAAKKANITNIGVDLYFEQQAKADNKKIEYLESAFFQLNLLTQMGQTDPDKFISDTLSHLDEFPTVFQQLLSAWRNGDTNKLSQLIIEPMKADNPTLFKLIMTDRNIRWIGQIEQMFDDHDTEFVLVGVGHLVGENNVLQLLQDRGYQVVQLTND